MFQCPMLVAVVPLPVTPITASSAFGLRADALHPGEVTSGALQNLTQLRLLGVT